MVVIRGDSLRCKVERLLQKKQSGLGIRVQSDLIKTLPASKGTFNMPNYLKATKKNTSKIRQISTAEMDSEMRGTKTERV